MAKNHGMGKRLFWDSAILNDATYLQYQDRLTELALSTS